MRTTKYLVMDTEGAAVVVGCCLLLLELLDDLDIVHLLVLQSI
jgi:hypothetical protein